MKKLLSLSLSLLMVFSLAACGGTPVAEQKPPLTEDEVTQMYTNPDSFKGRQVTLTGKLLGEPEKDDSGIYFQFYGDAANYARNTIVGYKNTELSLADGDYIKVIGTVDGTFKGENMMGGKITAPKIIADSVEKVSYIDAVSPTIKSVDVNSTQNQRGYEVSLQKVEFASAETRVYLSVKNSGGSSFSVYSFNAKIMQGDKQYEEQSNYDADYQEVQSDLMPGATTSGIIAFPAMEQSNFKIYIDGSSDNWEESIQPYAFEVAVPQ